VNLQQKFPDLWYSGTYSYLQNLYFNCLLLGT